MGEIAQDMKTGKTGEIIQVTGPAPFIYRLMVQEDGPPIVVYRYGEQLRRVRPRSETGTGDPAEEGNAASHLRSASFSAPH
ncbi:hypothetical protein ACTWQF_13660 [Streptomyces sp. 8N114]|uniref:hypothetical protein n=1 Tax=Streptomyces sp. 8N114 TaxID=3457419 RepID=UPI003FD43588